MRIRQLKMQGFGSFYEETKIDFNALTKNQKIFLIHGKTGSGKTTIFSAILCSLYGLGSNQRKPGDLVSKYAKEKESMVLDLYYQIDKTNYHIHREYTHKGHSKPKKQYLEEKIEDDWQVIAIGSTEVTQTVTEQLGVNQKQFAQIAMLQQGTISHLLVANKTERKEFLKELFQSFSIDELKEAVKDDYKKLQEKGNKQAVQLQDRWQEIKKEFPVFEKENQDFLSKDELKNFIVTQYENQEIEIQNLTRIKEQKLFEQQAVEKEIEAWKMYLDWQKKKSILE